MDNALLIDSWTAPAATNSVLTGTINLEKPADLTSFYHSIYLEYSKLSTGCHAFSLQWNLAAPYGPLIPPDFYALQVNCEASEFSFFLPETFPTCMAKSAVSVFSSQLPANSEILLSIAPKDALDFDRFFDDWTNFNFFSAKLSVLHKNPRQLLLSSTTGPIAMLSAVVSQTGQYQVVLGTQSQQFSVATLFSDSECSEFVSEISFSSLSMLSVTSRNRLAQFSYSCVIWKTIFRSRYAGQHTVILRNLSRCSAVKIFANDQIMSWNGSLLFSTALELQSHDILSLVITQQSSYVEDFNLQILEGRYFTDDPWSTKVQPGFASSIGHFNDAFMANYNIIVVSGATCHSMTKLQGHGLSVATEGSPAIFSIAFKDAFDNPVKFLAGSLIHNYNLTASFRDTYHQCKASSQKFDIQTCADSNMGCIRYTPTSSGSFELKFATGWQELGLVATYFSDLEQSMALASTFGLTEIRASGNIFFSNSEFSIRWSGFIQTPVQSVVTFSSTVLSEFESVFLWIDNVLVLTQESGSPVTSEMTFESSLTKYEIEVFYSKRGSNVTSGFILSANQAISYSNSYRNKPSDSIPVFGFRSQLLAFSPSVAKASSSTIVTIFGRQLAATCSYTCTWTTTSNRKSMLKSEWQFFVSPSILLCGTPSAATLHGRTVLQVMENCGINKRSLELSKGLQHSNFFIFQGKIVHSSLERISRSQRIPVSTELLLTGAETVSDENFNVNTACNMYGRSSSNDVEDYSGPQAVNSGIASQRLDSVIACAAFGFGDWNGVGQISLSVEDSLSAVTGSASILMSGVLSCR